MVAQTGRVFRRAYPGLRSRLHRSLTLGCIAKAPSGLPITGLTAEQNRYWIERPDFGILATLLPAQAFPVYFELWAE